MHKQATPKLRETDIRDPKGNIIISPGLKVRHKKSGYEYTVDSVAQRNGKVYILLNLPEDPRFEPPMEPSLINGARGEDGKQYIYDVDSKLMFYEPEDQSDADKLAVSADEFARDYEVK
jgi:hypothetical protein